MRYMLLCLLAVGCYSGRDLNKAYDRGHLRGTMECLDAMESILNADTVEPYYDTIIVIRHTLPDTTKGEK